MAATAVKTIKFDDLMKVMKKYVSKSETRPVLQCVQFANGYFAATDSHHLIRVNAEFVSEIPADITEGSLYDPKEMKIIPIGNYPDTSRLIPYDYNTTVIIDDNIKEFHSYLKEVKKVVKNEKNKTMKLEIKQNEITISGTNIETGAVTKGTTSMYVDGDEVSLHLSAKYLDIALDTVKKLSKLSNNKVHLGIVSNLRPMVFKQDGVFDIIVLPVRITR